MSVIEQDQPTEASVQLLAKLKVIDVRGWDSPEGNELLSHVRAHIVRPQVFAFGLRGPVAAQAEASGWELAWELLNKARLRDAASPWGVLWIAVRRAIQGEMLSAAYQTSERKSWRAYRLLAAESMPPVSLTQLTDEGWEPPAPTVVPIRIGADLVAVVAALAKAGWERRTAHAVVEAVAAAVARDRNRAGIQGWRSLASRLDLPPWQVRRVAAVLLGGPGWSGVVERMATRGPVALEDPDVVAALRATNDRKLPTSALAGRLAAADNPISAAS
jgi:hypothetical protein